MRLFGVILCRIFGHRIPDTPGMHSCPRCGRTVYIIGAMDDEVFSASPLFGKLRL